MIRYRTLTLEGVKVFYREAGAPDKPALLLLHGFPSSSFMFRQLMETLGKDYYLIAPDYPGFGYSDMPPVDEFEYTYEHYALLVEKLVDTLGLTKLSLYVFDYGAPVGFRFITRRPELLECLIVQNGNIYAEGVSTILKETKANIDVGTAEARQRVMAQFELDYTRFEYLHGVSDPAKIAPDGYMLDYLLMQRPGNKQIQYQLKYDYRHNFPLYPEWQAFLRRYQPPTLVVWGENDPIFTKEGALAYRRDVVDLEMYFYPTGHFALEECGEDIAWRIHAFIRGRVKASADRP